jgi:hypothetical protein
LSSKIRLAARFVFTPSFDQLCAEHHDRLVDGDAVVVAGGLKAERVWREAERDEDVEALLLP